MSSLPLPQKKKLLGLSSWLFLVRVGWGGEVRKNKKNRTEQNGEGLGCKRIPNQSRGVNAK